jgi:hypothetical protein
VSPLAASRLASCVVFVAFLGCTPCPKISQHVTVLSADPELLPLFEACRSNRPPTGESCPVRLRDAAAADCACLPLCRRVLEIIDQFQGPESIEDCYVFPLQDGGAEGGIVSITYRPSTCP